MLHNLFGQKIIDLLVRSGVTEFFLAPGSRSTPLALALAHCSSAHTTIHFDERGLAFCALGYAKATTRPAVIIVTSGTAVGNLLPALMEADQSQIPLILLTADRPPEANDIGANQTYDQIKLFSSSVRFQTSLPLSDPELPIGYLTSTLQQAILMSQGDLPGPVHINCPFREPLTELSQQAQGACTSSFARGILTLPESVISKWADILSLEGKGVILVGDGVEGIRESAHLLAKKLGWPLFADVLSCARGSYSQISHYDLLLQAEVPLEVDRVIQFGNRFVSKALYNWLKKQSLTYYLHVSKHPRRQDPHHLITDRLQGCPDTFIKDLCAKLPIRIPKQPAEWQIQEENCKKAIEAFFAKETSLSELSCAQAVASLQETGWALFIGNSLPIRDCDALIEHGESLFGNRGVSGIDGNIATAVGIAKALKKPVAAFLGDCTTLHDLNSSALIRDLSSPFVLFVSNNQGGGIFSSLPVAKHTKALDRFFTHSHTWEFSCAAKLFQIPYLKIETLQDLQEFCRKQKEKPESFFVELQTTIAHNLKIRKELLQEIRSCLHPSFFCTASLEQEMIGTPSSPI